MHPRKLLADAEPVDVPELAELAPGLLLALVALDELLPHAAISKALAAAATVTANEVCLTFPPLDRIPDAQALQGRPEHRVPGDYFVSVSGGNAHLRLRPGCCEISTKTRVYQRRSHQLPVRPVWRTVVRVNIDWPPLRAAAAHVAARAYAPYSRLRVGAAGLAADGRIVTGCNVENASFGLTLCAECGLVSALHAAPPDPLTAARRADRPDGGTAPPATPVLVAVAVVAGDGAPLLPCGRCRQLLLEAGGPQLLVDAPGGPVTLAQLLPAAFGGADLLARREAGGPASA
jgi:cytidine deaminase